MVTNSMYYKLWCFNLSTLSVTEDAYRKHINEKNPLGMGGNLAKAYGSLLHEMWSGKASYTHPRNLKVSIFYVCIVYMCVCLCAYVQARVHACVCVCVCVVWYLLWSTQLSQVLFPSMQMLINTSEVRVFNCTCVSTMCICYTICSAVIAVVI